MWWCFELSHQTNRSINTWPSWFYRQILATNCGNIQRGHNRKTVGVSSFQWMNREPLRKPEKDDFVLNGILSQSELAFYEILAIPFPYYKVDHTHLFSSLWMPQKIVNLKSSDFDPVSFMSFWIWRCWGGRELQESTATGWRTCSDTHKPNPLGCAHREHVAC